MRLIAGAEAVAKVQPHAPRREEVVEVTAVGILHTRIEAQVGAADQAAIGADAGHGLLVPDIVGVDACFPAVTGQGDGGRGQ